MTADTTTQSPSLRCPLSDAIIVEQTYKYRASPTAEVASDARRHIDICRQVYNHALGLYNAAPDNEKPTYTTLQNKLPAWKQAWSIWTTVNAKCLQMAVRRIYPEKPPVESITPADTVGIDLGILTVTHDSDGTAVTPLDEARDCDRIEQRHRELSRKQYESNNWEKAPQKLAAAYERLAAKRNDLREKLAGSYTKQYDAVFLEDLNVRGMLEQDRTGRNIASMAWRETIQAFKRHGKKNGCHVETVPPEGTTKRCAKCGVESAK
jgi:IS605 OrfB family transposase